MVMVNSGLKEREWTSIITPELMSCQKRERLGKGGEGEGEGEGEVGKDCYV